ncbi:hypothetical protein GCM10022419_120300 [Nonomuraea rosea]|uniref:FUSC family protein n=1 Tax=Nonomuraea rosea TaxID=638574 RepID=A0ABP6ZRZ5_9ACTN
MIDRLYRKAGAAARRELRYMRVQLAGLGEPDSPQRFEARQIAKATVAAVLAWFAADRLLADETVWIAPATAVIMVHATVYRTLTNGLRRVIAVAAGVFLAGGIGHLIGLNALSLLLVVPPALIASRWHRMGRHGSDVATTAVLLLSFGAASQDRYLAGYVLATAAGALTGAGVNVLLWPPLYQRRPYRAVRHLGREAVTLLQDIATGLRHDCDLSKLPEWQRRATELDRHLAQARRAIADGVESRRYNLRRLRQSGLRDYTPLLAAMTQTGTHVHAIVRALAHIDQRPGVDSATAWISIDFARDYADLLDTLAAVITTATRPDHEDDLETPMDTVLETARAQTEAIQGQMTDQIRDGQVNRPQGWAASGSLLTDAERILTTLATAAHATTETPAETTTPQSTAKTAADKAAPAAAPDGGPAPLTRAPVDPLQP